MHAALDALFSNKPSINGVQAANKAVANCGPDNSIITLTRSEYQDILNRTCLPELKRYKGKMLVIISDECKQD